MICPHCNNELPGEEEWAVRHALTGSMLQMVGELLTAAAMIGGGQFDKQSTLEYLDDVRESLATACDGVEFAEALQNASKLLHLKTVERLKQ